jgi:hypothetical protein
VNGSDTTRRAFEIGVIRHRGEVDELLEPAESWPQRTTFAVQRPAKECLGNELQHR